MKPWSSGRMPNTLNSCGAVAPRLGHRLRRSAVRVDLRWRLRPERNGMPAYRPMLCMLLATALIGGAQPARTQTYPTQTITLQVAFAAGGIADVVARLVGQKLSQRLGHTVVVENRGRQPRGQVGEWCRA